MADPTYTFTPAGDPGDDVRLLISDVGGETGDKFIFSNEEIARFIALRGDNTLRGAALALRTIAANRVMVAQRIKYLGLETDGPAEAKALRSLAGDLEDKADMGVEVSGLEFAEITSDDFDPWGLGL